MALAEAGFVEVRRRQLAMRLGFATAPTVHEQTDLGRSDFSWWAVQLDVCPLRWRLLKSLELQPCVGTHVGRISVAGRPVDRLTKEESRVWVDASASARLELSLLPGLSLHAQGSVLVPLSQYEFFFENPDVTVYRVPEIAASALFGLTAHFP